MYKRNSFALICVSLLTACNLLGGSGIDPEHAVRVIALQGGIVTSADGQLTLEIPGGALSEDTNISIVHATADKLSPELLELAEQSGGLQEGFETYDLQPSGLTFDEPVTVSFPAELIKDPNEPTSIGISSPSIYIQSGDEPPEALDNLEVEAFLEDGSATVSGSLTHFSVLTLIEGQLHLTMRQVEPIQQQIGIPFGIWTGIINNSMTEEEAQDLNLPHLAPPVIYTLTKATLSVSSQLIIVGRLRGATATTPLRTVAVSNPVAVNMDYPDALFPAGPRKHTGADTLMLQCIQTGKGTYTLNVVADGTLNGKRIWRLSLTGAVECVAPTPPPTSTPTPSTATVTLSPTISPSLTSSATSTTTSTATSISTTTPSATVTKVSGTGSVGVGNAFGRYGPSQAFPNEYEFNLGQELELIGIFYDWLYVFPEGFDTATWIWSGLVDTDINIRTLPYVNWDAGLPITEYAPKATGVTGELKSDTAKACWNDPKLGADFKPEVIAAQIVEAGANVIKFVNANNHCVELQVDPGTEATLWIFIGHDRGLSAPFVLQLP